MKKKRGRPRKPDGVIAQRDFARAGIAMAAYDKARKSGQKHSVAIAQAVQFVKLHYPKMAISESGVKRILAKSRPRKSQDILCFERTEPVAEELAKVFNILKHLGNLRREAGVNLPMPSEVISKPITLFKIRFGHRPEYPRHNGKPPNE